jgi:hypothetical protein
MANPAEDFKGLPIEDLIATPLVAAASSQAKLAMVTADFIQKVGIDSKSGVKTVEFRFEDRDPQNNPIQKRVDVPLLSIVNIPSLAVKNVEVEFTMEVKTQSSDKSENCIDSSFEAGFSSKWSPWSCSIKGAVSTKSENTRSTDKSAKYDIKVVARDDGMPEGLSRVLDILNNSISNNSTKPVQPQPQQQ